MKSRILVVDDEELMREYVEESLKRAGHEVDTASSGAAAVEFLGKKDYDLFVTDLKMRPMDGLELVRTGAEMSPGTTAIVMTAYGTIETAVEAMKAGAEDYILKPFAPDELEMAVERVLSRRSLAAENRYLRDAVNASFDIHAMIGDSPAMGEVYEHIAKVAESKSTVLIRGESGTGKELVARAIHYRGNRRDKPFIKVNCAALSAGLLESELFGHERGAFTGAHERKIGRFELADRGTLLLDEVSEVSIELQPKLLRALQEREIDRVGGTESIPVDVRIIATSNRRLEEAIEEGTFREDLFFRLNVIPIELPPVRERKEDIPSLVAHFLARYSAENGKNGMSLSPEAHTFFMEYEWPGNVREIQNSIERAVVLSSSPTLGVEDFSRVPHFRMGGARGNGDQGLAPGRTVAEMEKELIIKTLEHCDDNRTRASQMLGISVRTLRNKLNEYRR